MADSYDVVIVGSGVAASTAAMRLRGAGRRIALIDHQPLGGTCALRGCDPKKVLVGAAAALDRLRRLQGQGLAGDARIDWPALMRRKRTFTQPVPAHQAQAYAERGIASFHGRARFTAPERLNVGDRALATRDVIIAAGAEPVRVGIPGEEHLVTHETFLELPELPSRIVLVGGGYIAAEFSHIAARAGARVTVLQRAERMLGRFDPDLVGWLMERFRSIGIDVRTQTPVEAIEKHNDHFTVHASSRGGRVSIDCDLAVHAAGRAPALAELDLQAGRVATEARRLRLNEFLQSTSNPRVYAAGDAAQAGPPLTPVARLDAEVVAANLLEGNRLTPDYRGVPSVAFTEPPIAAVGLSEAQARKQGLKLRVRCEKASGWYTARQAAEPLYGFKVLVEPDTERILGAHLLGPQADELINLFAIAIRHELTARHLRSALFAYPTAASDVRHML